MLLGSAMTWVATQAEWQPTTAVLVLGVQLRKGLLPLRQRSVAVPHGLL